MKRMTAILLTVIMVLSLCCGTAFAETPRQTDEAREQQTELLAETLAAEVTTVDAGFPDADLPADGEEPAAGQTDGEQPDLTEIVEDALTVTGNTSTRLPTGTRTPRRSIR